MSKTQNIKKIELPRYGTGMTLNAVHFVFATKIYSIRIIKITNLVYNV